MNMIAQSASDGNKPRDTIRVVAQAGECRVCVASIPALVSNNEMMPLAASRKSATDQDGKCSKGQAPRKQVIG